MGLTKLRVIEIAVAVLLTLAALLFVGLTVWAADELHEHHARPNSTEVRFSPLGRGFVGTDLAPKCLGKLALEPVPSPSEGGP